MVRPIMRDPLFLAGKSEPATEEDRQVVQDLFDTGIACFNVRWYNL